MGTDDNVLGCRQPSTPFQVRSPAGERCGLVIGLPLRAAWVLLQSSRQQAQGFSRICRALNLPRALGLIRFSVIVKKREGTPREIGKGMPSPAAVRSCILSFTLMVLDPCINYRATICASEHGELAVQSKITIGDHQSPATCTVHVSPSFIKVSCQINSKLFTLRRDHHGVSRSLNLLAHDVPWPSRLPPTAPA